MLYGLTPFLQLRAVECTPQFNLKLSLTPKQQLVFATDLIYVKQAVTTLQM